MPKIKDLPTQASRYWKGLSFAWKATAQKHALYKYLHGMQTDIVDCLRRSNKVGHVVELACGTGVLAARILNNCQPKSYTGIDINPISFKEASKLLSHNPKVTLIEGDIYDNAVRTLIPKADKVICFDALMHFSDLAEVFSYIHDEVLVSGGKFLGNIINSAQEKEMYLAQADFGIDRPDYKRTGEKVVERRQALEQFRSGQIPEAAVCDMIQQGMLRANSLTRAELEQKLLVAGFQVELIREGCHLFFIASKTSESKG